MACVWRQSWLPKSSRRRAHRSGGRSSQRRSAQARANVLLSAHTRSGRCRDLAFTFMRSRSETLKGVARRLQVGPCEAPRAGQRRSSTGALGSRSNTSYRRSASRPGSEGCKALKVEAPGCVCVCVSMCAQRLPLKMVLMFSERMVAERSIDNFRTASMDAAGKTVRWGNHGEFSWSCWGLVSPWHSTSVVGSEERQHNSSTRWWIVKARFLASVIP